MGLHTKAEAVWRGEVSLEVDRLWYGTPRVKEVSLYAGQGGK
jgi:hypothetical protein